MRIIIGRGQIIGTQTDGPPLTDGKRYWKCEKCEGVFDVFDLGAVLDHEAELPHPAGDRAQ
jgi:hypothetical protein